MREIIIRDEPGSAVEIRIKEHTTGNISRRDWRDRETEREREKERLREPGKERAKVFESS